MKYFFLILVIIMPFVIPKHVFSQTTPAGYSVIVEALQTIETMAKRYRDNGESHFRKSSIKGFTEIIIPYEMVSSINYIKELAEDLATKNNSANSNEYELCLWTCHVKARAFPHLCYNKFLYEPHNFTCNIADPNFTKRYINARKYFLKENYNKKNAYEVKIIDY